MTEDIYFSSILFFNARKLARVENDAYFYCVNENASTNSNGIKLSRFKKNISLAVDDRIIGTDRTIYIRFC